MTFLRPPFPRVRALPLLLLGAAACSGTEDPGTSGSTAGSSGLAQSGAGGSLSAGAGGVSGAGASGAGTGGAATGGAAGTAAGSGETGGGAGAGVGGVAGTGATAGAMTSGGSAGALAGTGGNAAGNGGSGAGAAGIGGAGSGGGGAGGAGASGASGTAGSAAGNAGSAGAGGYQPCPTDGSDCKVLPLGDSITFGVGDEGNGGYRGPLFARAVSAGKTLTFTGSLMNGPNTVMNQTFPKRNEGHSGWGIVEETPYSGGNEGIIITVPSPAMSSGSGGIPHIVLLHIGTNDSGFFTAGEMTDDLSELLDKIITSAPDALVVVAQIIPLGYGTNDVIRTYNQSIPGLVQARASAGKHVVLVDMFTGFNAGSMLVSDDVHPNTSGYEYMADQWYSVIGSLLPG